MGAHILTHTRIHTLTRKGHTPHPSTRPPVLRQKLLLPFPPSPPKGHTSDPEVRLKAYEEIVEKVVGENIFSQVGVHKEQWAEVEFERGSMGKLNAF
jgi:hypothetical protein